MKVSLLYLLLILLPFSLSSQEHHDNHSHSDDHEMQDHAQVQGDEHGAHGHDDHGPYDPAATAFHHISDANVYTLLDKVRIPLPMILYSKDHGLKVFSSGKFEAGHHDNGHYAYDGYVLYEGNVHRIKDNSFPMGKHEVEGFSHQGDAITASVNHNSYEIEPRTSWDGGLMGGQMTSFYDLSITKNVASMILVSILLGWLFITAAKSYEKRDGQAPKGIQSFLEPLVVFIRDEVGKPFIGPNWENYMGILLAVFFFILGLNFWGQVPFFGGTNVTGNITVTAVLAIIIALIVNFKGNKHYWQHILWMPGVPILVKPILTVVEVMSIFIKPLTLMLRLAGNITAGHIAIVSFISLIFILGNSGQSLLGAGVGTLLSVPLTLFMMALELLVAFVQAFVFTILAASYIGAAIEEHH